MSPQCIKTVNGITSPLLSSTPNYEQLSQKAFVNTDSNEFNECPNGFRPKIEKIEGIALIEQRPITRIQLNSAEMCLNLCKKNTVSF